MDLLEDKAVLEERLDEKHALDENKPKLVEDFICAFCTNFPRDPVMCDRCENVFCEKEQMEYFSKPNNETCCHCRQIPKVKIRPLNRKIRRKMQKLRFECQGCKSVLGVSDAGMGQGKHEDFCDLKVNYKCACDHNFTGTYSKIKTMLKEHLIKECEHILC